MTGIDSLYFIDLFDAPKTKIIKAHAALKEVVSPKRHALCSINGNGSLGGGQEMNLGQRSKTIPDVRGKASSHLPLLSNAHNRQINVTVGMVLGGGRIGSGFKWGRIFDVYV
jgi:hypothetical protein